MRILWVKSNFLHPLDTGGTIRTYQMLRQLKKRHHLTYVALDAGEAANAIELAEEYAQRVIAVRWRGVPTRQQSSFYIGALANLWSSMPLALGRWVSPELRAALEELSARESFDVAVADFLVTAPHFDAIRNTPKLLFQHNVETLIWRRMHEVARGPLRWYFGSQARRMHRWEGRLARGFDHVVAVSEQDASLMRDWFDAGSVSSVPTGVDAEFFHPPDAGPSQPRVVFLGSLDWLPNVDAVRWFLADIWPLVRRQRPDAEFHVVGRCPPMAFVREIQQHPGARVWADVPDVRPHLWGSAVTVIPLRVGGGTRIKAYEALACANALVSTSVGVEGLALENGKQLLVADDAPVFADAVIELLDHPEHAGALRQAGRGFVETHCSWENVAEAFTRACEAAIGRSARPAQ